MAHRSFSLFTRFSIVHMFHVTLDSRRRKLLFRKLLIISTLTLILRYTLVLIVGVVLSLAIVCAPKVASGKTCVLTKIAEYYDKLYRNMYRGIL